MTDVGTAVGTLGYMAPEQMKGQPVDHRADIFALGAVLHEMVAGAPAFRRDSRIATVNAVLESDPPALPDTLSPAIRRIIARCVEKDPDERFQSARDLAFALNPLSDTMTAATEPTRRTAGAAKIDWRIAALAVLVTAVAVRDPHVARAFERRDATSHDEALPLPAEDCACRNTLPSPRTGI